MMEKTFLELNETNSMIQIKPNSGCKIDSVKVNGNHFSIGYDGACEIKLTEGMRVDVATSALYVTKRQLFYR